MTTNNRMELMAVIVGLETVKWQNADITVVSDSSYVVNAVNKGWVFNWEKKAFQKPGIRTCGYASLKYTGSTVSDSSG